MTLLNPLLNLFPLSPLSVVITLTAAFIAYWFFMIVVRPLQRMSFYRNQSIPTRYFPLIGKYYLRAKDFIDHHDIEYWAKFGDKEHRKRALCSNLGSKAVITLYDPALIKDFYLNQQNYIRDVNFTNIIAELEGKGIFIVEGEQWKAQRKIISASFNFDFLKSILGDIQKIANRTFREQVSRSPNSVDALLLFQEITAEVMGSVFFGEKINDYKLKGGQTLTRGLSDILTDMGALMTSPLKFLLGSWVITKGVLPKYARSMKRIKDFRKACTGIIEQRRKAYETQETNKDQKHKDMVQRLLEYQGEEGKLTNERIVDEFITFYAGGTDTTSHLLTMCACQLIKHPEVKAKLVKEIKEKYDTTKEITIDELNNLEYVSCFLKETLRTYTPAPGIMIRMAVRDHNLQDITIKKGDLIDMNNFYQHFNPKYFPDPVTFNPDRWRTKNALSDPYAFTPFSAGPRNCIGQHLAMNEAKIILCELLSKYDFEHDGEFNPRYGSKLMYCPVDPVLLNLKPVNHE